MDSIELLARVNALSLPFDLSRYMTPTGWRYIVSWLPEGQHKWHIVYGGTIEEVLEQLVRINP